MPRYSYKRRSYLGRDEVLSMVDSAKHLWLKALICLLYLYGMRISEALRLKPSDFRVEYHKWLACRVELAKKRKASGPVDPTHVLRVNFKKESLSPFILPLVKYVADRKQRFPREPLWTFDRTTLWKKLKELNPNCSPHFFRHNRLYKLAEKGATAAVLRDWAGWADLRPASNYIEASGQLARKYADEIE